MTSSYLVGSLYKEINYFDWLGVARFTKDIKKVKQPTPGIFFKYLTLKKSLIFTTDKMFRKINAGQKKMEVFMFRIISYTRKQKIIC